MKPLVIWFNNGTTMVVEKPYDYGIDSATFYFVTQDMDKSFIPMEHVTFLGVNDDSIHTRPSHLRNCPKTKGEPK